MSTCYLCGGKSNKSKIISLHQFPIYKPDILKQWLAICELDERDDVSKIRLCSLHFRESDLNGGRTKKYIKPEAVPIFKKPKSNKVNSIETKENQQTTTSLQNGKAPPVVVKKEFVNLMEYLINPIESHLGVEEVVNPLPDARDPLEFSIDIKEEILPIDDVENARNSPTTIENCLSENNYVPAPSLINKYEDNNEPVAPPFADHDFGIDASSGIIKNNNEPVAPLLLDHDFTNDASSGRNTNNNKPVTPFLPDQYFTIDVSNGINKDNNELVAPPLLNHDFASGISSSRNRRCYYPRSVAQIELKDFETPRAANITIRFVKDQFNKKLKIIKKLRQENYYLKNRLKLMNDDIKRLKKTKK